MLAQAHLSFNLIGAATVNSVRAICRQRRPDRRRSDIYRCPTFGLELGCLAEPDRCCGRKPAALTTSIAVPDSPPRAAPQFAVVQALP